MIHQDPILSQIKLIAEPWDVGPGGYQVGNFPVLWSEWNGIYRDVMRDFWRGEANGGEFARRLTGSSDLYEHDGRRPFASVNFITAHDGFTLRDLVSYNEQAQRRQPRGQPRRHRRQPLLELRRGGRDRRSRGQRAARAPAAQLPRHAAALPGRADAAGRRRDRAHAARQQQRLVPGQRDLVVRLGARRARAAPARLHAAADRAAPRAPGVPPARLPDRGGPQRLRPAGRVVVPSRRPADDVRRLERRRRRLGFFLNGEGITAPGPEGERVEDDSFLLLFNASAEDSAFTLPSRRFGKQWALVFDTFDADVAAGSRTVEARGELVIAARSLTLLRRLDHVTAFRATYRLQLGRRAGLRRRRRARAVPERARHLAPVPLARVRRTRGLDARLRRDRPDAPLGCARRRAGLPRARGGGRMRRAWGSCSTSSRTTWRPTTRTRTGPASSGGRSSSISTPRPGGTGASSTSITSPACARRIRRCSPRRTGSRSRWSERGSSTACASTTPTGSRIPPATWSGCTTAAPSTSGWRRSSTPASSCATGRSRAPSATSSRSTPARCSSTRRARPR